MKKDLEDYLDIVMFWFVVGGIPALVVLNAYYA